MTDKERLELMFPFEERFEAMNPVSLLKKVKLLEANCSYQKNLKSDDLDYDLNGDPFNARERCYQLSQKCKAMKIKPETTTRYT